MDKKFIVVKDLKKGSANFDIYSGDFDTLEEANNHATMLWDHLTAGEKQNRTVNVYHVTLDDLEDYAKEDLNDINWAGHYQTHQEEGYFNSEKLESIK